MSTETEADIQALIAEMKNLRADFVKIGDILKDTARHGAEDASDVIRERAERQWNGAKDKAQSIFKEMEDHPMGSAITMFGIGILLGLIVGRR